MLKYKKVIFKLKNPCKYFKEKSESTLFKKKIMIKGIGFELEQMIYQGKSFEQC